MTWTDKELNDAEESVTKLVQATGLTEKEVVRILEDGLIIFYGTNMPEKVYDLIDELKSTFDAY